MPSLSRRKLGGKPWRVNPGIAPGSGGVVTGGGSGGATAFTFTLSAASATAGTPVTVTVSPTAGAWPAQTVTFSVVTLTGSFASASIVVTPASTAPVSTTFTSTSAAGTSGQIVVAGSTMTNTTGPLPLAIVAAVATGFTMTGPASGFVNQGEPLTFAPTPAGSVWPSGNITGASSIAGSFAPNNVVPLPAGSGGSLSLTYTPTAAGTASISATNTAGLPNPAPLSYSIAASGGGSSATLTLSSPAKAFQAYQQDTYSSNPPGFSTTYGKGWGTLPITVTPSAPVTTGIYLRLHDALSSGAAALSPGTGTILQPTMQVTGISNLVAGANSLLLTIPAAKVWFYLDLGLNPAMSNAVRLPVPFGVGGITIVPYSTSHMYAMFTAFQGDPSTAGPTSGMVSITPFGSVYFGDGDAPPAAATAPANLGGGYLSPGVAQYLAERVRQSGVVHMIDGCPGSGGSLIDNNPNDYQSNHGQAKAVDCMTTANNRWEAQIAIWGANDIGFNQSRHYISRRQQRCIASLDAAFAGASPYVGVMNTTPLWAGVDSSTGFRIGMLANHDTVATRSGWLNHDWCDSGGAGFHNVGGHEGPLDKAREGMQFARLVGAALGPTRGGTTPHQGPQIVSAVRSGTDITLTCAMDGGDTLVATGFLQSDTPGTSMTAGTPTSAQLGKLFAIYPAGKSYDYSPVLTPLALDASAPVTILSATTIRVRLAADPGAGVTLDLYHGMDLGFASLGYNALVPLIADNFVDGSGWAWGLPLRRTVNPVYVAAPTPAAQTITVSTPPAATTGAWFMLSGGGTGAPLAGAGTDAPATSIEVSVNSGAWAAPSYLIVRNGGQWSGYVVAPGTAGSYSVGVRRAGQSAAEVSTTVTVVTAANKFPSSFRGNVVAAWHAANIGTMFQDTAATIPAAEMQPIRAWLDTIGGAKLTPLASASNPDYAPYLDQRGYAVSYRNDRSKDRPYVHFETRSVSNTEGRWLGLSSPAFANAIGAGSFSVLASYRAVGAGSPIFSLGQTANASFGDGANNLPQITLMADTGVTAYRRGNTSTDVAYATGGTYHDIYLTHVVMSYDNTTGVMTVYAYNGATAYRYASPAMTNKTAITTMNTMIVGAGIAPYTPQCGETRLHELVLVSRALTPTEATVDALGYQQGEWTDAW